MLVRACPPKVRSITGFQGVAYGAPVMAMTLLTGNVFIVLQGVYAKYFGLPLATIAWVFLVSRIFDAVTDPIIGGASDRYFVQRGTRKPFIVVGGFLLIVSAYFLYTPPDKVESNYFLAWMLMFFLGMTLIEIPHMAWGGSLAASSEEKNRIYSIRSFFLFSGVLLFFGLPYLPIFETREVTPQTLEVALLISGCLMVPALFISTKYVPNSRVLPTRSVESESNDLLSAFRWMGNSVFANKPLLIISAAHICTGIGAGVWFSLLYIFTDSYLGLGEQFALAFIFGLIASLVALPFWNTLNRRYGKRPCWAASMLIVSIGYLTCLLLNPENASFPLLVCIIVLVYVGLAEFNIAVPAFISDAADYGEWKFKVERGASYFALYTFINKSVGAIGASLGLAFVAWVGFDPSENEHSAQAVLGLRAAIAFIPALFFAASLVFISKIQLTEHRHSIVRRRLDARAARLEISESSPRVDHVLAE